MGRTALSNCQYPVVRNGKAYPCGQCILCRRRRMLEWGLRGIHELGAHHNKASFLTLTYKPRFLPKETYTDDVDQIEARNQDDARGNLRPNDVTLFLKRLRKYIDKNLKIKIKYVYCGEYGTLRFRPHYHIVLYGVNPEDIEERVYKKLWRMGKVDLDKHPITEKGIFYTVGYSSKKFLDRASRRDIYIKKGRMPPFLRTSKGIGKQWALDNIDDWTNDLKLSNGTREVSVPRYYIKLAYKMEGTTVSGKVTRYNLSDNSKQVSRTYKTFINPDGHYTKKIYNARINNKLAEIKECEEDISNDNYFEILKIKEAELAEINKYEKQRLVSYNTLKTYKEAEVSKWLEHRTSAKQYSVEDDTWEYNDKPAKALYSEELVKAEKDESNYKVQQVFKGLYGKRQRMEELQDILGEGI